MYRKLWLAGLLALLLTVIVAPATFAGGLADDKIVVGEDYVLAAGQRLDGNLAVIGGNVTLERDSVVTGDVAVLGGTLNASGAVRGSVAVFGGAVTLNDTAVIEGDLAAFGGSVERAAGATVMGDVFGPRLPELPARPSSPVIPAVPGQPLRRSPLGSLLLWEAETIGWVLGLILVGVVALLVAPKAMARIASAVAAGPAYSFGVGLLTWAVAFLGGALLLIACGLGLLVWLVTAFALLLGWLAVGLWAGQRLLRALKVANASALAEMALGVFLITVLARLPFCVGFLCFVVIGAAGLGAVVLTRFGTQSMAPRPRPDDRSAPVIPVEPQPIPPATVEPEAVQVAPVVEDAAAPILAPMEDDLEIVIGVGPEEASKLQAAGVHTLADLTAADPATLGPAIGVPVERIVSEDWVGQARRLHG